MESEIINIIKNAAQIPSFSSYEERIHPFIYDFIKQNKINCSVYKYYNNLIIEINPNKAPIIAFTSHLDKINHFGNDINELPFEIRDKQIKGQLDDSVGVGICLYLLKHSRKFKLPHSLFLFSEMEESFALRNNRASLKNFGRDLEPQIGAKRISQFLIKKTIIPNIIITFDTTPLFRGEPGISLYSKFWEISGINPSAELIEITNIIENKIQEIHPEINFDNNVNDYIKYGTIFASNNYIVPSIAIEPAIYPYHRIGEQVYITDIEKVINIIKEFIRVYIREKFF